jgi:NitT/TauT family transport system permease protein
MKGRTVAMRSSIQHSTLNIEHSTFRFVLPLITSSIILAIWAIAVKLSGTKIFPSPVAVAKAIATLSEKSLLWRYIGDSLTRVFAGYLAAIVAGIPIGFLMGWHAPLARAINPLIQMLRPISPLAWMPLAVIWFGVSNAAPIFLIFLASLFPIIVAAMNGVRNVPPMYLQAGRNFGLSTRQLMIRVVAPAVLPRIIVGLRLAFGIAWVVLVAAEMIAVDSGLGYLIIDARNAGKRYDLVVAGMLMIGVIGLLLDTGIRRVEEWISE